MPGTEDLIRILDASLEKSQIAEVMAALVPLKEEMKNFQGISLVTKDANGIAQFKSNEQQISAALLKIKDLEEQLEKIRATNATKQKVRTDQEVADSQRLAQEKRGRVADIRAEENAYKALNNEYRKAQENAKIMIAQYGAHSKEARAATAALQPLADKIHAVNKAADDGRSFVGRYTQSIKDGFKDIVGQAAQMVGAFYLIQKTFGFIKDSIASFKTAADTAARLQNILHNMGRDNDFAELNAAAKDLSETLGTVTIADVQETFQKLYLYGNLSKTQILQLVPVIANFAATMHVDMAEATDTVTKALEGNARGLKTFGINIKEGHTASERFGIIMTELKPKLEGNTQALSDLSLAQKKAEVTTEELKVKIGEEFAPVVTSLWKSILQGVEGIPQMVRSYKDAFVDLYMSTKETWFKIKAVFGSPDDLAEFNAQKAQNDQIALHNQQSLAAEKDAADWRKANANDSLDMLRKELHANQLIAASSREKYIEMQKLGQLSTAQGEIVRQNAYRDALIVRQTISLIEAAKDTSPIMKRVAAAGGGVKPFVPGQVSASFDVQRDFNDLNAIANRESGLDQGDTSKFGAAPGAGQFSLSDAAQKNVDDYQKLQLENKKKIAAAEVELAKKTEDTIASFVKARYENELNDIQKKIDANDKAKEKETAAIQNSTLSQQEKAAAEINLTAQTEAKNEALRRKQREIKVQEAKFDRDKAIFDIIASTASGVMKASPLVPLMALVAATGAVELAGVIAKPIPTYKKGGVQAQDSPMLVHPGEIVLTPQGTAQMTPDAPQTLMYGKKGTRIIPANEVNQMMLSGMMRTAAREIENNDLQELKDTIREMGMLQIQAMKRKQAIHIHTHVHAAFESHINNAVRN